MVAHSTLTGSDLHEVKGAASATANTVLMANGDGTTSFVDPTTLGAVVVETYATAYNASSVNPSLTDAPVVAGFSTVSSTTDVTIDTSGTITFNSDGVYFVTINATFGRSTSTGTAVIASRLLLNDVQLGYTQSTSLASITAVIPFQANIFRQFNSGDVLKLQIMRDSTGTNDGGMIATAITPSGWGDQPSYWVRVGKISGAE